MSQERQRVSFNDALNRLSQFPHLYKVINRQWLEQQYQREVENYSLITGWLSTSELDWDWNYRKYTSSLNDAVAVLSSTLPAQIWGQIRRKLRTQSGRSETKGTLAEVSLAVFLAQNSVAFEMEKRLDPASQKDVDFRLNYPNMTSVHIEMQWLSESERSSRAADALAPYRLAAPIGFPYEEQRIRSKVASKTSKLTPMDITLVALDCTSDPVLGGDISTIQDALRHTFDRSIYTVLTEEETEIRRLVDGVIWFESAIATAITPTRRGYILNEHSTHCNHPSLIKWIELWSAK